MNLNYLLEQLGIKGVAEDVEVSAITEKAESVTKGSVFVAVKGKEYDGNKFIREVLEKGACAVISDADVSHPKVINVSDSRTALSFLCSAFYAHPQDEMKIIGITGTNGKTTTAEYLRHIIEFSGKKCAVMGTLGIGTGNEYYQTGYTTPCPEVLFRELNSLKESGCDYCVTEVSSQALAQKRVEPITFELGVLTNIGTDHLDYHGSVEKYVNEKTRLFALSRNSLINADDAYCERFASSSHGKTFLYSAKDRFADYMAKDIRLTDNGLSYIMLNTAFVNRVKLNTFTDYAVYNTLAAASAANILGISPDICVKAFENLPTVKGRLEKIGDESFSIYVDFAHTPQALRAVLSNLKRVTKGELICVFGCGGNRDKTKRAEMGAVADEYADCIILTADNPRNEDVDEIIADIYKGIKRLKNVFKCPDRERAIELALNKASVGDCVLIAGKGHECYQNICGENKFFSDELTVKKLLGVY